MGWSLSWLVVKGKSPQAVLDRLGLAPTGERHEVIGEAPFSGAGLADGWYVVFLPHYKHELSCAEPLLAELSRGGEIVTAGVEEHVMASMAAGWRDGVRRWQLDYESGRSLEIDGEPPEGFEDCRRRLTERQANETEEVDHLIDIPLEMATLVCGFSLNDGDGPEDVDVLAPTGARPESPRPDPYELLAAAAATLPWRQRLPARFWVRRWARAARRRN